MFVFLCIFSERAVAFGRRVARVLSLQIMAELPCAGLVRGYTRVLSVEQRDGAGFFAAGGCAGHLECLLFDLCNGGIRSSPNPSVYVLVQDEKEERVIRISEDDPRHQPAQVAWLESRAHSHLLHGIELVYVGAEVKPCCFRCGEAREYKVLEWSQLKRHVRSSGSHHFNVAKHMQRLRADQNLGQYRMEAHHLTVKRSRIVCAFLHMSGGIIAYDERELYDALRRLALGIPTPQEQAAAGLVDYAEAHLTKLQQAVTALVGLSEAGADAAVGTGGHALVAGIMRGIEERVDNVRLEMKARLVGWIAMEAARLEAARRGLG